MLVLEPFQKTSINPGDGDTARGADPSGPRPSEIGVDHDPPPNHPPVKPAYQRLRSPPSQNASILPGPAETTLGSEIRAEAGGPAALMSAEVVPHPPFRKPRLHRCVFVPRQRMLMSPAWSETAWGAPAR